jgi:hypothetical protein
MADIFWLVENSTAFCSNMFIILVRPTRFEIKLAGVSGFVSQPLLVMTIWDGIKENIAFDGDSRVLS